MKSAAQKYVTNPVDRAGPRNLFARPYPFQAKMKGDGVTMLIYHGCVHIRYCNVIYNPKKTYNQSYTCTPDGQEEPVILPREFYFPERLIDPTGKIGFPALEVFELGEPNIWSPYTVPNNQYACIVISYGTSGVDTVEIEERASFDSSEGEVVIPIARNSGHAEQWLTVSPLIGLATITQEIT